MSKKEWGNATWYLIHTLSYKLKEEYHSEVPILAKELFSLCCNLPCPECSQHALQYINSNKKFLPKNYSELNSFFWKMHNWVNKNLGQPYYSSENCVHKYKSANTDNVIKYFIQILGKNTHNERAMLQTFSRQRRVQHFVKYINNNIHKFNV